MFIIYTMIKSIHDINYQNLLELLKDARLERGLTIRQLANLVDEPFQFISKVETGQRRLNVYEYVQYCDALNIDPIEGLKILSKKNEGKNL